MVVDLTALPSDLRRRHEWTKAPTDIVVAMGHLKKWVFP